MPVGVDRMLNHLTPFRTVCRLHTECVQIIVTPFFHIICPSSFLVLIFCLTPLLFQTSPDGGPSSYFIQATLKIVMQKLFRQSVIWYSTYITEEIQLFSIIFWTMPRVIPILIITSSFQSSITIVYSEFALKHFISNAVSLPLSQCPSVCCIC